MANPSFRIIDFGRAALRSSLNAEDWIATKVYSDFCDMTSSLCQHYSPWVGIVCGIPTQNT